MSQNANSEPFRTHIVKGRLNINPNNDMVKHWLFDADVKNEQECLKAENEAELANSMAKVCIDNGMNANDLQHLFPAVLRMLKSKSNWTK